MDFDVILRGGRVIDPSQRLDTIADVGFSGGKVARIAPGLEAGPNTETRDVTGLIVTPGLIDLHTHVYWGGTSLGVAPDADGNPDRLPPLEHQSGARSQRTGVDDQRASGRQIDGLGRKADAVLRPQCVGSLRHFYLVNDSGVCRYGNWQETEKAPVGLDRNRNPVDPQRGSATANGTENEVRVAGRDL